VPRIADSAIYEAAPCKPEPKRPPYRASTAPMPPLPTRCPKCAGCVVPEYQEYPLPETVRCLNCGMRPRMHVLPQEPSMRKSGASLPNVMEVGR
jgi:hypothetical protein